MENQFLEIDERLGDTQRKRRQCGNGNGKHARSNGNGYKSYASSRSVEMSTLSTTFAAQDRALVILIENGGVDLGIPTLVDKLLALLPGTSLLPDSVRAQLVDFLREKIRSLTDSLLETIELSANRYNAAKPEFFGDVTILRDSTASYDDLKNRLIGLSHDGKVVDLLILTHGSDDFISVTGGINSQKIRAMKTENGRPLPLRSVYMMNCVGSSLNQAWIDAGAKVSSGALHNNYLPEPTTFFFWSAWKAGQTFETAVTSAYRKTINLMKDAVSTFLSSVPSLSAVAGSIDFENFDFVKDSAPVIQGQRSVTINSDDLSFTQTQSSSLATTVLPSSLLRSIRGSRSQSMEKQVRSLSPQGVEFIKQWEGFRSDLYNDPAGHCTIGYGTLVHRGNCDGRTSEDPYKSGVTADKAAGLLTQEAARFQQVINDSVTVALGQNQNDALISFVYNVGDDAFRGSTLLRLLNQGNYDSVPAELKKWTKARQNGDLMDLPGLVRRRQAEADLFQKADTTGTATAQSLRMFARSLGAIDYTIPGVLPVIAQPTPNTCWAAVYTMMYSWNTKTSITIPNALGQIGPKYLDMFQRDVPLDTATAQKLYDDAGLEAVNSFNPTIDGWVAFLRKYGPLYIDVGYNTGSGTHAIIVIGISGDGSPSGTSITYVDPIGGTTNTLAFPDFLAKYQANSAVQWPYTIVHWPLTVQPSLQKSFFLTRSFTYMSPSALANAQSSLSYQQNPALIAGIEIADAAQIGLGAIAVIQAQVATTQGSFSLAFDKVQRLLTNEARQQMPGAQTSKKSYSQHLVYLDTGAANGANADVIIEWEGNDYGEIGTPNIRRNLTTSTEWSKSSANITVTKLDKIPLPKTDPRTWPIVYTYEGTMDPWGNGYFEFSGEFEVNAFGGLKFNRHEVVSRSMLDLTVMGKPEDYVRKGQDVVVAVPDIPQEQIAYLRSKLP